MKNESVELLENSSFGIYAPGDTDTPGVEDFSASKPLLPSHDGARCESSSAQDTSSHGSMSISCLAGLDPAYAPAAAPAGSAGSPRIETVLIEPNALLREGLKRILFETPYRPVASIAGFHEIGSVRLSESSVVILIMDVACDLEGACRQIEEFKENNSSARIVILIEKYDREQVLAAFQSGADACLMKSMSCEAFVKSLDLVVLGEAVLPVSALDLCYRGGSDEFGVEHRIKGLSARETMILRCLMDGDSNKIIARKLDIAEATVKVHMKTILRKTRLKNRTQAAMWAATQNLAAKRPSTH